MPRGDGTGPYGQGPGTGDFPVKVICMRGTVYRDGSSGLCP